MLRISEDLSRRTCFGDLTLRHDDDAVAKLGRDAQIMRYEKQRQVEPFAQVCEQAKNLRLYRDIERGDRFVGDDDARFQRQRAGDADALPLSARELMRKSVGGSGRKLN